MGMFITHASMYRYSLTTEWMQNKVMIDFQTDFPAFKCTSVGFSFVRDQLLRLSSAFEDFQARKNFKPSTLSNPIQPSVKAFKACKSLLSLDARTELTLCHLIESKKKYQGEKRGLVLS